MTKYDSLSATSELEQIITADLNSALNKRGLNAEHMGTPTSHAPGNTPDIIVTGEDILITVEPTKTKGAAQDREYNAIKDHLEKLKSEEPGKKCFCIFISPETSQRMLDSIKDYNFINKDKGDLKILPLSFDNLELFVTKLAESPSNFFPISGFLEIFNNHTKFIDDHRIKKLFYEHIFSTDESLGEEIENEEIERDQKKFESLLKDLKYIEQELRDRAIALGAAAIPNLMYLVFIKLFEEKRAYDGVGENRFKIDNFLKFKASQAPNIRDNDLAIHNLFDFIKDEEEFKSSGMFSSSDKLSENLKDDFVVEIVIPKLSEDLIGTKIDALGAVYEVLALRSNKDVKVGQFFTPENVVDFMVKLAELSENDVVLDPACGTGRFLIWAMNYMLKKADTSSVRDKNGLKNNIRLNQLHGTDFDNNIVKIAKMNMWIHGDGKTNITKCDGLTINNIFPNNIDVILTNPPLGDIKYTGRGDDFYENFDVIPKKNKTQEKLKNVENTLNGHNQEKIQLEREITVLKEDDVVEKFIELENGPKNARVKAELKDLSKKESVDKFKKLRRKIKIKERAITNNNIKKRDIDALIVTDQCEYVITGNKMKGGALFTNAIFNYLKGIRDPDEQFHEWNGGKLLTIIDEGVLNTEDYSEVRKFIKKNFFIKAIISLSKDTFIPVSGTSTKTSILYAIKKEDPSVVQKEPIFYAHAEKVGIDTKKKICPNHLDSVLIKYNEFKNKVLDSYDDLEFNRDRFLAADFRIGEIDD